MIDLDGFSFKSLDTKPSFLEVPLFFLIDLLPLDFDCDFECWLISLALLCLLTLMSETELRLLTFLLATIGLGLS
jgi:hypothetical protein